MAVVEPLLLSIIIFLSCECSPISNNPVNGKHLKTVWVLWRRQNVTGVFGPRVMGLLLDYISKRLNFTYTMVENVTETSVERPRGGRRGLVDYLLDGSCDILAHDISTTPERYAVMDLTLPWIYADSAFLIPIPDSSANVAAVLQPFQWPVWMSFIVSLGIVTVIILIFSWLMRKIAPEKYLQRDYTAKIVDDLNRGNQSLYVFGVLMSQSGPCLWWAHSIRIVAAAWCLAAFVLVNSYCSLLITYVISHYNPPLIESVHDLVRDPTINMVIESGKVYELWFTDQTNQNPIFGQLREKLAANPKKSRCTSVDDCLAIVKSGERKVFVQTTTYLFDGIMRDFKQTGKCSLQIAKKTFFSFPVSIALKKHSPYTTAVGQAIIETFEYGHHYYWQTLVRRVPTNARDCWKHSVNPTSTTGHLKTSQGDPDKLTLTNLTGAFVILAAGCMASFVAFVGELMVTHLSKRKRIAI